MVEILVVMGIIAVLAVLGVVGISITQRSARDEARKVTASDIVTEINDYFRARSSYPVEGDTLVWSSDLVEIGSSSVALKGSDAYSSSNTDGSQTMYVYIKDTTGFVLCTLLEGGGWHKLGNGLVECPSL